MAIEFEIQDSNELDLNLGDPQSLEFGTRDIIEIRQSGDYNDLTNRPSVNGVELIGNKTTEDLLIDVGVTSWNGQTGDVVYTPPEVPVQSVNGQTGDVVLNASDVGALPSNTPIPSKTSDLQNDSGYITGITSDDVTSALGFTPYDASNPNGYVNATQAKNAAPVQSVNGKTGSVSLSATDVNALPDNTPIHNVPSGGTSGQVLTKSSNSDYALEWSTPSGSVSSVNGQTGAVVLDAEDVGALPDTTTIPSKTSDLTNDSNFITASQAPVQSVNGQTGTVVLDADDVGALPSNTNYALGASAGGNAVTTNGILYGEVDSTSTATVFTAQIEGVTSYYDGLAVMLRNNKVTSTTNFTININGLGAKPCYNSMATGATPTRDTTIFNANYTMLFVYSETLVSGGAWICYRGYNSDNNTIGYQLRTNNTVMTVTDTARYYKLYFTSADGTQWVPASVNSTNNATSARPVNQRPINPFGRIVYTSANTSYATGANLAATTIWTQYALVLGYSFNRTGAALTLTTKKPVYVKCAPQADGSAIMDADIPIVQDLPTTEDGKIYIYLGIAYDATHVELFEQHPVYYYKDGAIRPWTNQVTSGGGGGAVDSVNGQTGAVVLDAEDVGALPDDTVIPSKTSDLTNDSNFITAAQAPVQSVNGQTGAVSLTIPTVPTDVSDFNNDAGYITSADIPVTSVNTKTGAVVLSASDVGALPDNTVIPSKTSDLTNDSNFITSAQAPVQSVNGNTGAVTISVPTKTSDLTNDSGFITSAPVSSVNAKTGAVVLSASDVGALPDSTTIPSKTSDLTNDSGFITGMVILSYGSSTWADFLAAYQANKVVYCRASSNANPASGSQTRLAFMAYVNNETNPTSVEFQYYRSVSSHSASQQGDQVFVYTLTSSGWSVVTREAVVKIVAGTNMTQSYSNGTLTLQAVQPTVPTNVSAFTNDAGYLTLADLPIYQGGVS